jgi:hypothetical protein
MDVTLYSSECRSRRGTILRAPCKTLSALDECPTKPKHCGLLLLYFYYWFGVINHVGHYNENEKCIVFTYFNSFYQTKVMNSLFLFF